jgi:hypothetical protein
MAMNILVPQNAGRFLNSFTTGRISRRDLLNGVSYLLYKLLSRLNLVLN